MRGIHHTSGLCQLSGTLLTLISIHLRFNHFATPSLATLASTTGDAFIAKVVDSDPAVLEEISGLAAMKAENVAGRKHGGT